MGRATPWQSAEEKALLSFTKEHTGNEMVAMDAKSAWKDLVNEWEAKGFDTTRTAKAVSEKHQRLRKKAGRVNDFMFWSAEEEETMLSFVKERKGDDMVMMSRSESAWNDLEKEWQAKGFNRPRTATAMCENQSKLGKKRAEQPVTTPLPSTTSTTTAPTPPLRSSSRKRTLTTAPSTSTKKTRASPSPPLSASTTPSTPIAADTLVVIDDSDIEDAYDTLVVIDHSDDDEFTYVKSEVKLEIKNEHAGETLIIHDNSDSDLIEAKIEVKLEIKAEG